WQGLSQKARQRFHRNQRRLLPSGTEEAHSAYQANREAHSSGDRPAPQRGPSSFVGCDFTGFLARLFEKGRGGVFAATAVRPYRSVPAPQPAPGGAPRNAAPG